MLKKVIDERSSGFEKITQGVQKSLVRVAKEVAEVPDSMTEKFGKCMDNLVEMIEESLKKRDKIYLKKIDKYADAVKTCRTPILLQ